MGLKQLLFFVGLIFAGESLATTYHVSKSGSPGYFSDIQSAVNTATNSGDLILIHEGSYALSNAVSVSLPVVIEGVTGPSGVIIDGGGVTHCFELADVGCVLSGLTIRNGFNENGAGGVVCGNNGSPVITNCVITGCFGDDGGGISGGTVYGSQLSGNLALNNGGGARFSRIYNSLIKNNVASNEYGGGAFDCILFNCTSVGNRAGAAGGGVDGCDVYNSIIYGNQAPEFADLDPAFNPTLVFSCSPDAIHGESGNITNAPLFMNLEQEDFRLSQGSPCINAGNNNHVFQIVDLDGKARIFGATVDMGAYEFQATESDQDGDGLPDIWEVRYFGHITNGLPNMHSDSDLFVNLQEYIAGTDPTNSASYFAVTNFSTGSFVLEWPVVSNREYRVYWTDSFTNDFSQPGPVIDYPVNSYTDTAHSAEGAGFYKVEVRLK